MAIEEVHIGAKRQNINPRDQKEKGEGDPEYWERKAKEERAKREYLEEKEMQERISNKPEQPEAPFKIKGEVNLGVVDVQEQQRRAEEIATQAKKESENKINQLTEERDKVVEALHNAEIQHVQQVLGDKIESLRQAIASGEKKSIIEELAMVDDLASKLGYVKPAATAGTSDLTLTIELKKLEQQIKKDDREFQRLLKQDERNWEVKKYEFERAIKESEAKIVAEHQKWQALTQAPVTLGSAIAKGLVQNAAEIQGGAVTAPKGQTYHVECGTNESGEVPCESCEAPVGIGPTAKSAICANCGSKYIIKRTPAPASAPAEETPRREE